MQRVPVTFFTRRARKRRRPTNACAINAVVISAERQIGAKSWAEIFSTSNLTSFLCTRATQEHYVAMSKSEFARNERKERKERKSFYREYSRNLSPPRVFVYPCALTMAELRNNWVVEDGLSGVEREQGINRLERGKEKVMGDGRG